MKLILLSLITAAITSCTTYPNAPDPDVFQVQPDGSVVYVAPPEPEPEP